MYSTTVACANHHILQIASYVTPAIFITLRPFNIVLTEEAPLGTDDVQMTEYENESRRWLICILEPGC